MKTNKGFASVPVLVIIFVALLGASLYMFSLDKKEITPILTQIEAETLVYQIWSDCTQGDCGGVTVTIAQNTGGQYIVTAIFIEYDDSVALTKREAVVTFQNGVWRLGQQTITWSCQQNRGHSDFSVVPCI